MFHVENVSQNTNGNIIWEAGHIRLIGSCVVILGGEMIFAFLPRAGSLSSPATVLVLAFLLRRWRSPPQPLVWLLLVCLLLIWLHAFFPRPGGDIWTSTSGMAATDPAACLPSTALGTLP